MENQTVDTILDTTLTSALPIIVIMLLVPKGQRCQGQRVTECQNQFRRVTAPP